MPRALTEDERQEFLAAPHIAVLSVAAGDHRPPLAVPIWYHYAPGGDVTFFTGTQGRRARKTALIRRAGAVSLTVQQEEFPWKYVTVEASLVAVDQPPTHEQMLPIAGRYLPGQTAQQMVDGELTEPSPELTLFTVHPDRWITFDFAGDA